MERAGAARRQPAAAVLANTASSGAVIGGGGSRPLSARKLTPSLSSTRRLSAMGNSGARLQSSPSPYSPATPATASGSPAAAATVSAVTSSLHDGGGGMALRRPRRHLREVTRWEEVSGNAPRWAVSLLGDAQRLKHVPLFVPSACLGPGQHGWDATVAPALAGERVRLGEVKVAAAAAKHADKAAKKAAKKAGKKAGGKKGGGGKAGSVSSSAPPAGMQLHDDDDDGEEEEEEDDYEDEDDDEDDEEGDDALLERDNNPAASASASSSSRRLQRRASTGRLAGEAGRGTGSGSGGDRDEDDDDNDDDDDGRGTGGGRRNGGGGAGSSSALALFQTDDDGEVPSSPGGGASSSNAPAARRKSLESGGMNGALSSSTSLRRLSSRRISVRRPPLFPTAEDAPATARQSAAAMRLRVLALRGAGGAGGASLSLLSSGGGSGGLTTLAGARGAETDLLLALSSSERLHVASMRSQLREAEQLGWRLRVGLPGVAQEAVAAAVACAAAGRLEASTSLLHPSPLQQWAAATNSSLAGMSGGSGGGLSYGLSSASMVSAGAAEVTGLSLHRGGNSVSGGAGSSPQQALLLRQPSVQSAATSSTTAGLTPRSGHPHPYGTREPSQLQLVQQQLHSSSGGGLRSHSPPVPMSALGRGVSEFSSIGAFAAAFAGGQSLPSFSSSLLAHRSGSAVTATSLTRHQQPLRLIMSPSSAAIALVGGHHTGRLAGGMRAAVVASGGDSAASQLPKPHYYAVDLSPPPLPLASSNPHSRAVTRTARAERIALLKAQLAQPSASSSSSSSKRAGGGDEADAAAVVVSPLSAAQLAAGSQFLRSQSSHLPAASFSMTSSSSTAAGASAQGDPDSPHYSSSSSSASTAPYSGVRRSTESWQAGGRALSVLEWSAADGEASDTAAATPSSLTATAGSGVSGKAVSAGQPFAVLPGSDGLPLIPIFQSAQRAAGTTARLPHTHAVPPLRTMRRTLVAWRRRVIFAATSTDTPARGTAAPSRTAGAAPAAASTTDVTARAGGDVAAAADDDDDAGTLSMFSPVRGSAGSSSSAFGSSRVGLVSERFDRSRVLELLKQQQQQVEDEEGQGRGQRRPLGAGPSISLPLRDVVAWAMASAAGAAPSATTASTVVSQGLNDGSGGGSFALLNLPPPVMVGLSSGSGGSSGLSTPSPFEAAMLSQLTASASTSASRLCYGSYYGAAHADVINGWEDPRLTLGLPSAISVPLPAAVAKQASLSSSSSSTKASPASPLSPLPTSSNGGTGTSASPALLRLSLDPFHSDGDADGGDGFDATLRFCHAHHVGAGVLLVGAAATSLAPTSSTGVGGGGAPLADPTSLLIVVQGRVRLCFPALGALSGELSGGGTIGASASAARGWSALRRAVAGGSVGGGSGGGPSQHRKLSASTFSSSMGTGDVSIQPAPSTATPSTSSSISLYCGGSTGTSAGVDFAPDASSSSSSSLAAPTLSSSASTLWVELSALTGPLVLNAAGLVGGLPLLAARIVTVEPCFLLEMRPYAYARLARAFPRAASSLALSASLWAPHQLVGAVPCLVAAFADPSPRFGGGGAGGGGGGGGDRFQLMCALAALARPLALSPGEPLFDVDDAGDAAYVVLQGEVGVAVPMPEGEGEQRGWSAATTARAAYRRVQGRLRGRIRVSYPRSPLHASGSPHVCPGTALVRTGRQSGTLPATPSAASGEECRHCAVCRPTRATASSFRPGGRGGGGAPAGPPCRRIYPRGAVGRGPSTPCASSLVVAQ